MIKRSSKDRNYQHLAQARSGLQEADIVKKLNAVLVRGSGRGHDKGDVKVPDILRVECKNTEKQSFVITREMLKKMKDMCEGQEVGFIAVDFIDKDSMTVDQFVVTPFDVMLDYAEMKAKRIRDLK